jgi:hypothetical protein
MSAFIPGLELGEMFFKEAVKPLLDQFFPGTRYSAALIGSGSEILAFDTEMSTDHHWGPRVMLFFEEHDYSRHSKTIKDALRDRLPPRFHGYSTNFTQPNAADKNVQLLHDVDAPPINHRVETFTIRGFFKDYLNFDLDLPIQAADWLTFPEQKILTITAGAVYHDDLDLQSVRDRFSYYPDDVWLYLLACGWNRVGQDDHLMGRAGIVGDEIGSAIIGARLVRDIMRLGFLMERKYAPYAKWFGTAFGKLKCAGELSPALTNALAAQGWQERQKHLVTACERLARMHNSLAITEARDAAAPSFFGRPFKVIHAEGFAKAITARIVDPALRLLASRGLIGSVDQLSDSTDLLSNSLWRPSLRRLYEQ